MSTAKTRFTETELLTEHGYARQHLVAGHLLHGGFLSNDAYQSPRCLYREVAFDAWCHRLEEGGGRLFEASAELLAGQHVPNLFQHHALLSAGIGTIFWNQLTITGKIEARGRLLAEMDFPELAEFIESDISDLAIGHLNGGLLKAHGYDEGGSDDNPAGAHDAMWFVLRDLAFGRDAFDDVEPPESIGRPEESGPFVPELEPQIEGLLSLLANLLIIEFRAELFFADAQDLLLNSTYFDSRRSEADLAAEMIGRIRTDEEIHVRSLQLYLGELRTIVFHTVNGGTIGGDEVIDRFWGGLVRWATIEQPTLEAPVRRAEIVSLIEDELADGQVREQLLAEFIAYTGPKP